MSDEIIFKGTDRSEALRFIAAIRKKAFACGKQRDDEWIADVASACFEGEAAAWYESLDVEIRRDWTDLCRELLKQWPAEQSGGAPTPAAVAPGQNSFGTPSGQVIGIVKVITNKGITGYLSRTLNTSAGYEGTMTTTDDFNEAIRVSFRPSDAVHDIHFKNGFPDYPLLGFHFGWPNIDVYSESDHWAYLSPYQVTSTGTILLPPNLWDSGPPGARRFAPSRWKVERGGTMRPYVVDDKTYRSRELEVIFGVDKKFVFITHHAPSWLKHPPAAFTGAQLIFQPC